MTADPIIAAAYEPVEVVDSEENRCRLLWAAVIHRAIADWVLYKDAREVTKRKTFYAAHKWMFVEVEERLFPSFVVICHHLDLDPSAIRGATKSLTRDDLRDLRRFLGLDR